MLIICVVVSRRQCWWEVRSGKGAAGLDAIARRIIRVRQVTEGRGALLISQACQFRRRIVGIRNVVRVRIDHARSSICIIVANAHRARVLGDRRQAIGIVIIVIGVGDLRLARDRHRRSPARVVVRVVHGSFRGHFLRQPIQPVIGARDGRSHSPTNIFLLYLRDPIARVIGVVRAGPVLEGGLGAAIQGIIGVGGGLTLSIEYRGQMAVIVVGIGNLRLDGSIQVSEADSIVPNISPRNQNCHQINLEDLIDTTNPHETTLRSLENFLR